MTQSNPYKIVVAIIMYIDLLLHFFCLHVYIGEVLYCPYYKRPVLRLPKALLFSGICSSCYWHMCHLFVMLMTHDNLCKPTPVKQVVAVTIVILSNICCAWTMYLCTDYVLIISGASIFVGALLFCDNLQTHWGSFYWVGASNRDITV